ncbi:alpha/beta fold hydrolase [Mesorhizobium xinjiangense]|uniref:alpha/beta fold hydrolase n=1 Tax=Mesorhizobium xinjiangense TaxID=2678685 RepID=UPI0012EDE6F1|nr:alpha/beta fold hydrolase [Mesorhizobium xinjiangense]
MYIATIAATVRGGMTDFRMSMVDTGEVRLQVAEAGDTARPLIVLLHGFPEYWVAWRAVMERLAATFHVVAPDQRGYNLSSRPDGVDAYRVGHMVCDIDALVRQYSPDRPFVLAGHDWGASVAYAYAIARGERLSHLVVANGVHPACFQRAIHDDPGQRAASQYINRLRAPDAEERLGADGYRRLLKMIAGFSKSDWMTPEMEDEYRAAWSRTGALTAMLNWYRASPIDVPAVGVPAAASNILSQPADAFRVAMPHLVIWGEADEALRPTCLADLPRYAPDLTVRRVPGCGHWILHERPDDVAAAIREFVAPR